MKKKGAPNIIGISAHYHDSAACLMVDGELVLAAEEERFTRRKHDPGFPAHAFRFCLEGAGLGISDIDRVAFYEQPDKKLARQIWMAIRPQATEVIKERVAARLGSLSRLQNELRAFGYLGPVDFVDHHSSHAASSFYFSGFSEAAILTVDGVGEWTTTGYARGEGKDIDMFERVDFPHSLGLLYSTITSYLGFLVNNDEYKVMGLAPYGEPRFVDEMWTLIELEDKGGYRLSLEHFDFLTHDRMYSDALIDLFGQPPREEGAELLQFHKDVAKSLQVVLEETLLEKVRYLHSQAPSPNLCLAGGVALNCVANGRLLAEGPFERLFVQPAATDAGGALGAAATAHVRLTGARPRQGELEHVYLGPAFSTREVKKLLRPTSLTPEDYSGNLRGLLEATVDRLVKGEVIGWFSGRMEFGPRALGARSILADPREPGMRDRINALVKKREGFRPFAPAVLAEMANVHFDLQHRSPFMLETCQVKSKLNLPAVTHVDGSARVQTVDGDSNPRFAALLRAFYERTGCPVLLNTSFNVRGEPIVCNPLDAFVGFVRSNLDCLIIEDLLCDRSAVPELWEAFVSRMPIGVGPALNRSVYTLL